MQVATSRSTPRDERKPLKKTMEDPESAIRKYRTANATVTLSHDGVPVIGQAITLQQKSHQFLFGSTWGESTIALVNGECSGKEKEQAETRNRHFLDLFNQVTMPFYWAQFEPVRGQAHTQRILKAARWYSEQGCTVKGHPLCWHTLTAPWLLSMKNSEILQAQVERIRREVADFTNVINTWDVINEAVIMPVFDRHDNGITRLCKELGRIEMIRSMFAAARETNPKASLLLNDFDVSPAYDILVEGCLEAGIPIDGIGIQSHMHQGYWGVERTLGVLEHFERFKLPIHFTENTIVSGQRMPSEIVDLNDYQIDEWPSTPEGEQRQAQEVVTHYKTLFSHPAVQSITWWDLSDGGWLNAPAGLLRRDQTTKPAYDELLKLIKGEWWYPSTNLSTDAAGQFNFRGFLGTYEISAGDRKVNFPLDANGDVLVPLDL
jgi:endo-1,4-beta-xylanase